MNELCRKRYAITRWFMQDPIKCFSLLRGHLILSFSNVIYNSNCCVSATPLLLIYYVNGLFVYQFLRLVALSHTDYMACYGVWTYLYIYIFIRKHDWIQYMFLLLDLDSNHTEWKWNAQFFHIWLQIPGRCIMCIEFAIASILWWILIIFKVLLRWALD